MPTTDYTFTTPANYTYDADKIEVTGGVAKLKDQRPADATFAATYTTDINGNWGDGTLTGTAFGGATVSGGKLDLKGSAYKRVQYSAVDNIDFPQVGCIRFKYIPNYTGAPPTEQFMFSIGSTGSNNSLIALKHRTTADFQFNFTNSSGAILLSLSGFYAAATGVEAEFEVSYDFTTGATKIFIDGILRGSSAIIGARSAAQIVDVIIGSNRSGLNTANFEINDLIFFDTIQHTANYTPGYTIPETVYDLTGPGITPNSTLTTDGILTLSSTVTESGGNIVKLAHDADGTLKYWDGVTWSNSSGFAQSNTITDAETNISSLSLLTSSVPTGYLVSADGSETPEIDNLSYNFNYNPPPIVLTTVNIVGYLVTPDGEPDTGATVSIQPVKKAVVTGDNAQIQVQPITVTTDADGGWNADIVPSADIEDIRYRFKFTASDETETIKYKTVAGTNQVNYEALVY